MRPTYSLYLGIIFILYSNCSQKTTTNLAEAPTPSFAHLPLEAVPLTELSAWNNPGANWQLAGTAFGAYAKEKDLQLTEGSGILANLPSDSARENLFSSWEHGDLELELEFLLPKGSNSGVYLQGRYEVQLLDSWGNGELRHADCGGIYQRWDPSRGEGKEGFEGHPPQTNASRAPNLWQKFHILFRAPKFDESGQKISPATFEWVYHNGQLIHENVEVFGPTRAAAFEDEAPMGPLMLQGDHGPVAFRNIRFKKYGAQQIDLGALSYEIFDYEGDTRPDFDSLSKIQEGTVDSFNIAQTSEKREHFAMKLSGEITVPTSGTYLFQTLLDDGGDLFIDGQPVVQNGGEFEFERLGGVVDLTQGTHTLELHFFQVTWRAHATVFYEGPEMELQPLASIDPFANRQKAKPLVIEPGETPEMLRGFVQYKDEKRTQVLSVGHQEGVHYSYDLEEGALLSVWKGKFADVSQMWVARGHSQLLQPLNAPIEPHAGISLAFLDESQANWPLEAPAGFKAIGYHLDEGMNPIFDYQMGELTWEDQFEPLPDQVGLKRSINLSAEGPQEGLYFKVAEGTTIDKMPNNLYRIDGSYFLDVGELNVNLTDLGSQKALLLPVLADTKQEELSYSLIW
ncbi:MAG: family 16 glycoside hydrolase [Bacteroidota bacterium]